MLFRNFTPFPPLQFESRDENRNDFGVVVLRGTFEIRNGARLRLVQEQEPVVVADEYYGEPGQSSLRFESNIAPYKPKTDLLVNAIAFPPSGQPETEWPVRVEVGGASKELLVTGPRQWTKSSLGGWRLSDIEPAAAVPVRYEYAYGGADLEGDGGVCEENPVGVGFCSSQPEGPVPAPQVLPPGGTGLRFGEAVDVAGLGPVAPAWSPRRLRAGTFNAAWEKTRWPDLPEDFSFEFYNTASAGLTLPGFADGTETIRLTNLSRVPNLQFQLPSFELATLLRFEDGRVIPGPVNLDTIHVEVPDNRVYLCWRGVFPVNVTLRVLEVRMKAPQDVIYQPPEPANGAAAGS